EIKEGVCIFCGGGNNGGDGFVIARQLFNQGVSVKLILCADPAKIKGDAKINFGICQKMGLSITKVDIASAELFREVEDAVAGCGLLVDALLGTGLQNELTSSMALLISCSDCCGRYPFGIGLR
ncbi:MAG: NAD(P)H-hydrate epimerase, partial [Planctomycetota bacterium]